MKKTKTTTDFNAKGDDYKRLGRRNDAEGKYSASYACYGKAISCYKIARTQAMHKDKLDEINQSIQECEACKFVIGNEKGYTK